MLILVGIGKVYIFVSHTGVVGSYGHTDAALD